MKGGLERLDPEVLDILRLGAHQILALQTPSYATVSQSVDLTREAGRGRAAGLVNAVLRALDREGGGEELFPDSGADPVGYLSSWGSHPRWLVERWLSRWSFDEVRELVEYDNQVPPLRVVPVDGNVEGMAAALREMGLAVEIEALPGTIRVVSGEVGRVFDAWPSFVQDAGAALVVRYAAPGPDSLVADLCAAPGGKALSLARTARYVLATDPAGKRLPLIVENARRTGLPVGVVRARGEAPPIENADMVLVDAPCTGTGTLRRHPDSRWRLTPPDPGRMQEVQARILLGSARAVRPGGHLIYATCSLEPEENAEVIERFLNERPDFRPAPPVDAELNLDGDALVVLPQLQGWDGAWAMRMVRGE